MLRTLSFLACAAVVWGADFKEFHQAYPLDPAGRFSLNTYKGSIRITTWDQAQVDVQARIYADLPGWFSVPVEDVDIRVDHSPASVNVKTDYHREHFVEGNLPNVQYTIRVPRRASVSVKDYKSDSEILGVEGAVEFETYKGTAHLEGLRSGLRLNTYKGDIRASFDNFAASHVETYKGDIELSIPKNAAFDISSKMERRGVLESDFPRTVRSTREKEYRGQVNGGGPELRVSSYRGTIRIREK